MKLKEFRVREFRSIWDSGTVTVDSYHSHSILHLYPWASICREGSGISAPRPAATWLGRVLDRRLGGLSEHSSFGRQ